MHILKFDLVYFTMEQIVQEIEGRITDTLFSRVDGSKLISCILFLRVLLYFNALEQHLITFSWFCYHIKMT